MTLLVVIILAVILLIFGISKIKKAVPADQAQVNPNPSGSVVSSANRQSSGALNPGSIPDGDGNNKGNGGSAMSSGMQG
jgi:hypothetical protein